MWALGYTLAIEYMRTLGHTNVAGRITQFLCTVPKSQGDPKIVKRGPNFWQKGDPKGTLLDVKGDLKFEFFRIVYKE